MTDIEKAKAEIDKTSKALSEKLTNLTDGATKQSEKLDGFEKQLNEIQEKQDADPSADNEELKKEVESIKGNHEDSTKLLNDAMGDIKSIKEQIDQLDLADQKGKGGPFSVDDGITKACEEVKEDFEKFNEPGKHNASIVIPQPNLQRKANMALSDFQNETIDRDRIAGVFFDPDRTAHIRAFINVTPTTTDLIRHVQEDAYTDNAGTTAEGAAAGQSSLTTDSVDTPARKISTFFKVSKESMADVKFLENHIRSRGISKILSAEDLQILTGNNVSPNLNGIKNQAASYDDKLADANATNFDVIANAANNVSVNGNGGYAANLALIHPNDMLTKFITAKDSNKAYYLPHIFSSMPLIIGGARVVPNTAVTEDDFFVGDFRLGATLALRSDIEISFSNSNEDDFKNGLVAILIEERIALVVYRPNAFIYSIFDDALGEATA